MMTQREHKAKNQILKILREQGYPTYARLLDLFDVNLTKDPDVVAYMEPGKARIVINDGLSPSQISTLVRHEILHEYFNHARKASEYTASSGRIGNPMASNIAGDFDISNRGYTDSDKKIAKSIILRDKVLSGLVTELDRPGWENLSFEEMYAKLLDERDEQLKKLAQQLSIGQKGNQVIQDAEEAQRRAEQLQDQQQGNQQTSQQQGQSTPLPSQDSSLSDQGQHKEGSQDNQGTDGNPKSKDNIAGEAGKLAKEAADAAERAGKSSDGPLKDYQPTEAEIEELQRKVDAIKKALDELQKDSNKTLERETEAPIEKERAAKADREARRYREDPLTKFEVSLNTFIKDSIKPQRGASWGRINKGYANTGIIKPGISSKAPHNVPKINVYFDQSGSWDVSKIKVGERAIATLNRFVKRGQIAVDVYYFAERVSGTPGMSSVGSGTYGQPIQRHIEQTHPDNVIIMTDSDIRDCTDTVTVPGAVWFLFLGGVSDNIAEHVRGKRGTHIYLLDRSVRAGAQSNYDDD